MPSKRQVLDLLSRDELVELVGRDDRLVRDGRSRAQLAGAGSSGHKPSLLPERLALRTEGVHALQSRRAADARMELR
ncbi:hypothetical protein [Sorangium sp. So ce861]|uniref:hypothetical protein n=1 Tax=Sorangium sp. So ce861 TaxID=3133323 RepID=UPI003F620355